MGKKKERGKNSKLKSGGDLRRGEKKNWKRTSPVVQGPVGSFKGALWEGRKRREHIRGAGAGNEKKKMERKEEGKKKRTDGDLQ